MKNPYRITALTATAAFAALLLAIPGQAQLPKDPEERAKVIAQVMQANSRQLTLFDRDGKELTTMGPKDLYNQPVFSPDAKRIAVIKADIDKETNDLWIVDVATGKTTQITTSEAREGASAPAWSPDGNQVAYVGLRKGAFGLYRKPTNGQGAEELLYQSNAPLTLVDWSMDGRYLTYFVTDLAGAGVFALPVNATGERKPIEMLRSKTQLQGGRLSPDNRFVAYASNESGKYEVYVRPFNANGAPGATPAAGPWKISEQGGQGMAFWRRDGRELYFLAPDRSIMSVSVTSSPDFEFGKPKVLFRQPEGSPVAPGTASINRDGDRVVIAVPPPQLRQLTVFDRTGKVVSTVGQPGLYNQPNVSPDGQRIVAMKTDPQTSNLDIWTYDIATGKATQITNDTWPDAAPIWSPDGKSVAYVSTRQSYSSIYRKPADGTGSEEMLFRYTPGAGMVLTDWSPDGKFMTFFTGVLLLVPVTSNEQPLDRKAIDWLREDYEVAQARFSPDGKFVAFLSNEADVTTLQVYVRPFDATKPAGGPAVQISKNKSGSNGMIFWRQDGKELLYMTRDWEVMSVDVTTTPTFQAGTPKLLFKVPGPLPGNPTQWKNISPDAQRFVFAMPAR